MVQFGSVEQMLDDARDRLQRLSATEAARRVAAGEALLVDIRPGWQRAAEGEVPGALIVERNHLEWRLHPQSSSRVELATTDRSWIVLCQEGYTSSLAADALNSLGISATDVVGGFAAWRGAGLPHVPSETDRDQLVP